MPSKRRSRHGLHGLMSRVSVRGMRGIDRRSAGFRALAEWRSRLEADLGGATNLSAQKAALLESVCRTRLFLDHIDAWLMSQESLVNKKRRSLYPVVLQRQLLADSLTRNLLALGLERKEKSVPSLQDYLRQKASQQPPARESEANQ
jgi:hypothetical protein